MNLRLPYLDRRSQIPNRPTKHECGFCSVLEERRDAFFEPLPYIFYSLLPAFDRVVFTRCANPRALSPATLESLAAKLGGPSSETVAGPHAAMARARELAGPDGAVVATGSIYLIADLVRDEGVPASRL